VFKNDAGNQSLLCVSAVSEDPAICAAAGDIAGLYCVVTARVLCVVACSAKLLRSVCMLACRSCLLHTGSGVRALSSRVFVVSRSYPNMRCGN
jgi:hypothetical protein